ncbi:ACTZ protein, partial [Piaya cayana]|nr:ACTZ protein [Piaya cayana]
VGRPKHVRVMAGALEGDIFIGPKAEVREPVCCTSPGTFRSSREQASSCLLVIAARLHLFLFQHPVLLTEAPLNPRKNRERAAEVFFETFNVPALFISMQAVLSLVCATGTCSGISADAVCDLICKSEGLSEASHVCSLLALGLLATLNAAWQEQGWDPRCGSFLVLEAACDLLESRACYLSINPQKDDTLETEKAQYYLPDGSTIEIGPARFRAPELLFHPDLIGEECEGLHEVLVFAIQKSDMDLRRTLFSNIVLSGGSTLFKGFGDRLLSEVKKLAPKDVKIRISAPQERLYSTWIGGSILASLDTFKKMWVSKKEYEEDGARAIQRKSF